MFDLEARRHGSGSTLPHGYSLLISFLCASMQLAGSGAEGRRKAMAEFNEVYRRARYYDIVFGRDVGDEVTFVAELLARELGRCPRSIMDLACGPGYHARGFAARGLEAWGLDLRPEMVAFAQAEAARERRAIRWMEGDIRSFRLPAPVDGMITTYDSIDCLLTQDEIVAHFRAVAANLAPGGLYLFEATHPRDCSMWNYGRFRYAGERDGVRVEVDWAVNDPVADPFTQVAEVETRVRVLEDGAGEQVWLDRAQERFTTAQEFAALARLSGALELVRCYGDFRLDQPFDASSASRRMIVLLRRPG
jgi:SAM-dependent methyltransferase